MKNSDLQTAFRTLAVAPVSANVVAANAAAKVYLFLTRPSTIML